MRTRRGPLRHDGQPPAALSTSGLPWRMPPTAEPSPKTTDTISRRWPVLSGAIAFVLVVLLGVLVTIRSAIAIEVDADWMAEILEERTDTWSAIAHAISWLGGGWF